MTLEIKSPWRVYPFSESQFKRWRFGFWTTLPNGERKHYPPLFEGPEWRRAGHRTILYDQGALDLFFQHLGESDRSIYRLKLQKLLENRAKITRRGRPRKGAA